MNPDPSGAVSARELLARLDNWLTIEARTRWPADRTVAELTAFLRALRPVVQREAGNIRCRELVQEIADSPIGFDYLDWVADVRYKARKALESER